MYTGRASSYGSRWEYTHGAVNRSAGEYVRGSVRTNGIEAFWSRFKYGYYGIYH